MTFRRKLFLFAALTSGSALVVAAAATLWSQWRELHQVTLAQVSVQTDIIATNLAGALSFDDSRNAVETLAAFRADPNVLAAFVCKADDSLFATYTAATGEQSSFRCGLPLGHAFSGRRLQLVRAVSLKGETLGTVIVEYGLDAAYRQMLWKMAIAALTLGAALAVAQLVGSPIRSALLRPVEDLGRAAHGIADTGNYETRVVKHADDELGRLADAFNRMVGQVQSRDTSLREARDALENRVRARTAELTAQKERLDDILRDVDAIVWEADARTWEFSFVSERAKDILGYPIAQWLHDPGFLVNLIHPDDREQVVALRAQTTERGGDHSFAYRVIAADGRVVWLQAVVRVVHDEHGHAALRGLMLDITDRKRDEALKAGHNRILELLSDGRDLSEILVTLVRVIEDQNPEMRCSVLLLDEEERLRVAAAPSLPDEYNGAIDGVRIGPSVGSCGTAAYRRERVIVENIATNPLWENYRDLASTFGLGACWSEPVLSADGRVAATLAMYYSRPRQPDRADLQLIETAAHLVGLAIERTRGAAERNRLALAVEATADGVLVTDAHGVIQYANPALSRITGYTSAELQGQQPNILKSGVQTAEFYREMWESIRAGQPWSGMIINRRKDGSLYDAALTVSPVRDKETCITGYVGVHRDVTADIQRERKLAEALSQAEASNHSKSEFLANMSHEIRTPMTAILGFAEQLTGDDLSAAERQDAVETIHRNGQHLLAIINDILDLSKLDAGKLEIHRAPCNPLAVVTEVVSLLRVRAIEKGLAVEIECDGPIPMAIETDPLRLRQILFNLVGNAIKFTETGGVTIRMRRTGIDAGDARLQFSVVDTGIGVAADAIQRLFRPFSQADATLTRRFGGTGLGLSIAKRLAVMLGGDIDVESTPGRGSTFRVTVACGDQSNVPMLTEPVEVAPKGPETQTGESPATRKTLTYRLLLAEDGPDNQRLISHLLRKAGAEVEVVENGALAVQAATNALSAQRPFDVVLMDMQMPVMDGYAATRRLRELGYQRPIIAVTAHSLAGDREKCLAAGCDDYVTKPINRATLLAAIEVHARIGESAMLDKNANPEPLVSEFANDPDFTELLELFRSELPNRISALETSLSASDLETLARLAHQLKGSAGGYGYPTITEAAKVLEQSAKARAALDILRTQVDALVNLCRRAEATQVSA